MAMFENFPYTNLHELNLDWLINEIKKLEESSVISVNGETGEVILYKQADVSFPNVDEDHWSIIRMADGTVRGIMFGNDDKAYIVHGSVMAQVYSQNNPPPYPVTSVNGQTGDIVLYSDAYVRFPTLTDAQLHSWNIYRTFNNMASGIEFDDTGSAYIVNGQNRYLIYTAHDAQFTDSNGLTLFPPVDNSSIAGWTLRRLVNNTPVYIVMNDDGTLEFGVGNDLYQVYTTKDTEDDIINIPTEANTDIWGLMRETAEGEVGIMFSNNDQLTEPAAYIRYVDDLQTVHTIKLLTNADIPSSSGVVSINGLQGVVVLDSTNLPVSSSDTRSIYQYISALTLMDANIKDCIAIVENGDTASVNITQGQYVIWKSHAYKALSNIASGDTLSSTNLSALTAGTINDLNIQVANNTANITTIDGKLNNLILTKQVNKPSNSANYITLDVDVRVYTVLSVYEPAGGIGVVCALGTSGNTATCYLFSANGQPYTGACTIQVNYKAI